MNEIKQAFISFIQNILSRKFMVFVVATVMIFMDKISVENWLIIAGAYMGLNIIDKMGNKFLQKNVKIPE